jgi:hypothetical protein
MLNSGGISSLKATSVFHVSPIDPRIHHPPHVLRYVSVTLEAFPNTPSFNIVPH